MVKLQNRKQFQKLKKITQKLMVGRIKKPEKVFHPKKNTGTRIPIYPCKSYSGMNPKYLTYS